jgi:prefoldin subunit 5
MSQLESLLEQMQRQIDELDKRIEALEAAEYSRFNTLYLLDGVSAPSTASGWAILYVDGSDGDLKVKFGDGTVTVIAADT